MREEIEGAGKICCRFGMAFLDACLVNEKTKKKKTKKQKTKKKKKKEKKKNKKKKEKVSFFDVGVLNYQFISFVVGFS